MKSLHKLFFENSKKMDSIPSSSVHLVVTSPPYPMIDDRVVARRDELTCKGCHATGLTGGVPGVMMPPR